MVEERGIDIKEVEPRAKILFINFSPGARPHMQMAQAMFGKDTESVESFKQMAALTIQSPEKSIEPEVVGREEQSILQLPESPSDFAAIVMTGSPFAAYPREAGGDRLFLAYWKKELFDFVRAAVGKDVPILGICYGEQVLAEALGGKTVKMRSSGGESLIETGWAVIRRSPGSVDDPVMRDLPSKFVAAENHEDVVALLPPDAQLLCENKFGVQGFRIKGRKVWGFAFHPERPPEVVREALQLKAKRKRLISQGQDPDEIQRLGKKYDPNIKTIFTNFLQEAWLGVQ